MQAGRTAQAAAATTASGRREACAATDATTRRQVLDEFRKRLVGRYSAAPLRDPGAKAKSTALIADRNATEGSTLAKDPEPVQPAVPLRPNKLAQYKDAAMVMASAQRLGVTKLGIVGNEQFVK